VASGRIKRPEPRWLERPGRRGRARQPPAACGAMGRVVLPGRPAGRARGLWGRRRRGPAAFRDAGGEDRPPLGTQERGREVEEGRG